MTFDRWKRQFRQMDLNEAKRLKDLGRENPELKMMLAGSPCVNFMCRAVETCRMRTVSEILRGLRVRYLRYQCVDECNEAAHRTQNQEALQANLGFERAEDTKDGQLIHFD